MAREKKNGFSLSSSKNKSTEIDKLKSEINKENRNINSGLFGSLTKTADEIDNSPDNDQFMLLKNKLEDVSAKYRGTTGSNPMEFFNRIELDSMSKENLINKEYKGSDKIAKNIDAIIRNSSGEFFVEEKDRFFRYEDYRLLDSYITEVSKCIDLYRDCILSPDDITKKAISFFYDNVKIEEENNIKENLDLIKKRYDIEKKFKNDLREGLLLGDLFWLIMPYQVGFSKILKEDEMFDRNEENDNYGNILTESIMDLDNDSDFNALFSEMEYIHESSNKAKDYKSLVTNAKQDIIDSINSNIKCFKDPADLISDIKSQSNSSRDLENLDIKGSIFKKLCPENIVKLELDGQVLGYMYVEKNNGNNASGKKDGPNSSMNALRSSNTGSSINTTDALGYGSNDVFNSRYDYLQRDNTKLKSKYQLISQIFVKGISKKINKDFLVKNQDFKELIYNLVYQEYITKKKVKMTFIEPQYVHHLKFASADTYGVSKCSKILFFGKIYLATLLTNVMQKIIRGRDKRAFYVDVGLDDDMEGTVNNFIKDIKSKELTSGTFKNVTTVLNSVGAFEDYYIPTIDGERQILPSLNLS